MLINGLKSYFGCIYVVSWPKHASKWDPGRLGRLRGGLPVLAGTPGPPPGTSPGPPGHPRDPRVFPGSFEAIKLLPMVGKPKDSNTLDRQKGSADQQNSAVF